jgi:putative methionine-R-sulfoxide reductase with GAF domain
MTNFKIYKITAFIALLIELIVSFVLFAKIKNILFTNKIETNESLLYVLIIIMLFIATSLFVLVFILSKNKNEEDTLTEVKFDDISDNDKENITDKSHELIDIESYLKKIIPKESSKFDLTIFTEKFLSNIAKEFDIVQGLFFFKEKDSEAFKNVGKYAYFGEEDPKDFKIGETLSGQVAKNKTILFLTDIPDNYVTILSGLGTSSPNNLLIIPVIINGETIGIIELASFKEFEKKFNDLFLKVSEDIGQTLNKH